MEIEKKYLVKTLPENLSQYEKWEIEQCYLCAEPTIRIRKRNDDYILTYKSREIPEQNHKKRLNVSKETEMPLNRDAYFHLREKADGRAITKTRYRIPYEKYTIELDIFHGALDGFCLAEVEFDTADESDFFSPPSWFGEDVSGDIRYTNRYLSEHEAGPE